MLNQKNFLLSTYFDIIFWNLQEKRPKMAFYPQFPPAAIYAYPMPFPNQELYAMYPPGGQIMEGSTVFYENNNYSSKKPGYNNRKESVQSTDSGISDFSSGSSIASRKTSAHSNHR